MDAKGFLLTMFVLLLLVVVIIGIVTIKKWLHFKMIEKRAQDKSDRLCEENRFLQDV